MSARTTPEFGSFVRDRLLDNKLAGRKPDSIRSLARAMANGNPSLAETHKRSLFKWIAPGPPHPSRASRALVADALGVDRSELLDEDDEESDPVLALMSALRRVVREELTRA